ncbi:MAG: hypothetical protein ABI353_04125 [Isosphaeraceae bacterium]
MSRRDKGLFRGSEFPRMVLLMGVGIIGWVVVYVFAMRGQRETMPRSSPAAQASPLPPADDAPEFQGIRDKTVLGPNDMAAYATLFRRVQETPAAELAAKARHDVVYSMLFDDPKRFRGLPIHLEGSVRRVLVHDDADPKVVSDGRMYESWVFTPDSQNNPVVMATKTVPKTLPIGDEVLEHVSFNGYFLKQMVYRDGQNNLRFAPLLVGRLTHTTETRPDTGSANNSYLIWTVLPLVVLFLYALTRWAFSLKRILSKDREEPVERRPVPSDTIDPDALSAWVAGEDGDEPGEEPGEFLPPDETDKNPLT